MQRSRLLGVALTGLALATAGGLALRPSAAAQVRSTAAPPSPGSAEERCASLTGARIGPGVVERAEHVAKGTALPVAGVPFKPAAGAGFCWVHARISPEPGSMIRADAWLPDTWNGKLLGVGGAGLNGGLALAPLTLGPLLAKGYAGAATDVGHDSAAGAKWAYHAQPKVVDWGHRGEHLTAVFAKAAIRVFYGRPAQHAYFQGCSNGGREALMEARRYPQDYDGIIAGAPASYGVGQTTAFVWHHELVARTPGASTLGSKLKLVQDAVLKQCDQLDGVADGLIENPQLCRFDPAKLQCKPGVSGSDCLDPGEVAVLRSIYQGPRVQGRQISSGFPPGGEGVPGNWDAWITSDKSIAASLGQEFFRWIVYQDPSWTLSRFDLDKDYAAASARLASTIDSKDPDLRAFARRGGKLIIYHGWDDAAVPAGNSLNYYDGVRRALGSAAADHVRLFMAPGMMHCAGGPGPSSFDMLSELDRWATGGPPPERVIASRYDNPLAALTGEHGKALQTRPLCAWPKTAHSIGTGSTDAAENFVCR
jgi:feruloyl esterase